MHEILAQATASEDSSAVMPRAMLVFAHQDDETVGLGARMGRFGRAQMVHVTDGAPRNEQDSQAHGFAGWEQYRAAREQELEAMLRRAGVEGMSRECLNIPDQQASLRLVELTRRVAERIARHRPEVIFTHPYEGGHPDHDACAFAVHHAVELVRRQTGSGPVVVECASYHAGPQGIETGTFVGESTAELTRVLTAGEKAEKQARFDCFRTQRDTLSYFQFEDERFRIAPAYDFTRPPHPGRAFYDGFNWGMTTERFCALAEAAERELQGSEVPECR